MLGLPVAPATTMTSRLTSGRVAAGLGLCAVLAVLMSVLAPSATAASKAPVRTWKSGVMAGYGPQNDLSFATWRGSSIQTATDFVPEDTWANIENPAWDIWAWGLAPAIQPVFSEPMFPDSGGSLAEAASGVDNAHWATLAGNLVAGGLGNSVIRLGWEFNGTWYSWSANTPAAAATYAQAWRQIVTAMRSVPGAHFTFDWCPTIASSGINPALAYPGNAYVDYIGEDVYDWSSAANQTPAARWNNLVNSKYGLAWQANFAAAHGKPLSFPEWGEVQDLVNTSMSGGDDVVFMQNMHDWFASHNTAFEDYFNSDSYSTGVFYGITTATTQFPNSRNLYQKLFSQRG